MAMGIAKYNAECRAIVTRYCAEWEVIVTVGAVSACTRVRRGVARRGAL